MPKRASSRSLPRHLALFAAAAIAAGGTAGAAAAETAASRAEYLHDRLQIVTLQRQRWERVITTHQNLAQHPNALSQAAADTAADLKQTGLEMAVEGVSGGLSSSLRLQANYVHRFEPLARNYRAKAELVDMLYKTTVKFMARGQSPTAASFEEAADGWKADFDLMAEGLPADVRPMVQAYSALSRGGLGVVAAMIRGDKQKRAQSLAALQSLLEGSLAMLGTLADNPRSAQATAGMLAGRFPAFGPIAGFMASTALVDFKISLALANIGFGAYGMMAGYDLQEQAETIFEQQQHAAVILQRLLPQAREKIRLANEEEARLRAELATLEKPADPPLAVLPSQRFIDDGVGAPVRWANLPFALDAIQSLPAVTSGITAAEQQRRIRAAEEAEARRRAAEEAAREQARRERDYAEERSQRYREPREPRERPSRPDPTPTPAAAPPPPSSDTTSCWATDCLHARGGGKTNACGIIREINTQTRGSALGNISC